MCSVHTIKGDTVNFNNEYVHFYLQISISFRSESPLLCVWFYFFSLFCFAMWACVALLGVSLLRANVHPILRYLLFPLLPFALAMTMALALYTIPSHSEGKFQKIISIDENIYWHLMMTTIWQAMSETNLFRYANLIILFLKFHYNIQHGV